MTTRFMAMLSNYIVGGGLARTSLASHVSSSAGVILSAEFPNGKQKQPAVTREIPETGDVDM